MEKNRPHATPESIHSLAGFLRSYGKIIKLQLDGVKE